jgi:hypothetical protein
MKPKGFIRILALVLVASALIIPTPGCFGDYKGFSRNDDDVFGTTYGGYWGIGMAVGVFLQFSPRLGLIYEKLSVENVLESRELQVSPEGSGVAYLAQRDLTVVLAHDDVNRVTVELAIPGNEACRFTLPAGELDAPWGAIEVDGKRLVTSDVAQLVVDIKRTDDEIVGSFEGRMQAEDGTLHAVSGSFSAAR